VGVTAQGVTGKGTDEMYWERTVHGLSRPGRGGSEKKLVSDAASYWMMDGMGWGATAVFAAATLR